MMLATRSAARLSLLSFMLAAGVVACADVPVNDDDSFRTRKTGHAETLPADSGGGLWINNGLHDADVSGVNPAFSLSSAQGLSPDGALLLDPDLRDTAEYLVECALPAGRTIIKQVDGQPPLELHGAIGLAPEWEDDPCDEDCQEWVSACLLARTNASGETVTIWMRADHEAIGDGNNPLYPVYEASFFGNLFEGPGLRHYCEGTTLAGPLLSQLRGRTCAGLTTQACGFVAYTQCEQQLRCQFPLLGGITGVSKASAVGCIGGSLPGGRSFHTISTYVSAL